MKFTYKHIVLVLIILGVIYYLNSNKSESFQEKFDDVDSVTFNADNYLMNLDRTGYVNLLVSNTIMPWVKFMEESEAEAIFTSLFENEENQDMLVKDLIVSSLDKSVQNYLDSNTAASAASAEIQGSIYNDIKQQLQNLNSEEIRNYGILLGFELNETQLTIPSTTDFSNNVNTFLSEESSPETEAVANVFNQLAEELEVTQNGITISIPSKYTANANNTQIQKVTLTNLQENGIVVDDITLDNMPNDLKYRIRNNRNYLANSLANIMNSMALQKGLDWKKVNVGGTIITDTTVNPSNVLNFKKSKIIRLKNLDLDNTSSPLEIFPTSFSNSKKDHVYKLLLDLTNTQYNSEDQVLDNNYKNYEGQQIWAEPDLSSLSTPAEKLGATAQFQNKIKTILEHIKSQNGFQTNPINFVRHEHPDLVSVDSIGLPLYMYDPYPNPEEPREIFRSSDSTDLLQDGEIVSIRISATQVVELLKTTIDANPDIGKKYFFKLNGAWSQMQFTNQFEWVISDLEVIGRNLGQDELERKFDLVAINNVLNMLGTNSIIDKYFYEGAEVELPLPVKYLDPYPLRYDDSETEDGRYNAEKHRNYALDNVNGTSFGSTQTILKRMKISADDATVLLDSSNTGMLQDDEVIVGKNDNILLKIINENGVRKYVDGNDIEFTNIDISDVNTIGWKVNFLKDHFNKSTATDGIKKELTLINLLIKARGDAEIALKNNILPFGARNKVSLVIINPPDDSNDVLTASDKQVVYENIANFLSNYDLMANGSASEVSVNQVKNMNRLNLASLVENAYQRYERLKIKQACIVRDTYPDGAQQVDATGKVIEHLFNSDILRLQKAMFGSFNNYIEPEDGLKDILYASYRLKLILQAKGDEAGNFLINQSDTELEKVEIANLINSINSISFADIDPNDSNAIQESFINIGITNESLGKIYKNLNLSDYFSVKIDLDKLPYYYDQEYDKIYRNKHIKQESLCSDDMEETQCNNLILAEYNYINAVKAIDELKSRLYSMDTGKQLQILNVIKENMKKRQYDTNVKNYIDTISLETPFKEIKKLHLISYKLPVEEDVVEKFTQNIQISGYNGGSNYYLL